MIEVLSTVVNQRKKQREILTNENLPSFIRVYQQ